MGPVQRRTPLPYSVYCELNREFLVQIRGETKFDGPACGQFKMHCNVRESRVFTTRNWDMKRDTTTNS